jgi:hypothetical protein
MPRTTVRETSNLPALLLAGGALVIGGTLVHDAIDRRLLTAESIFHSPLATFGAIVGVGMAAVLIWDVVTSRRR